MTIGARAALVAVGLLAPVACLLFWWRATRVDRSVEVRTEAIDLLRRVPMLRPLPVTAIEQLAQNADRSEVPAGVAVFEAGETGDSFYVVEEGQVEVLDGESVVRTMGPGEGFGEIALLGNTTRTMTVRAIEETWPPRDQCHRLPARRHRHQRGPDGRGGHALRAPTPRPGPGGRRPRSHGLSAQGAAPDQRSLGRLRGTRGDRVEGR